MHLIFDTETSGLIVTNYPPNHIGQGRIMQLACILLDDKFNEVASFNSLIDIPEHLAIDPKAQEAHGITKEDCKKYGIPIEAAIIILDSFRSKSDYQIGHNIKFDIEMVHQEEAMIFGMPRFKASNQICTMTLMTDICNIPHPRYKGKLKWPKLQEAHKFIFDKEFDDAHSALADVRATGRIYKWLVNEGYLDKVSSVEKI